MLPEASSTVSAFDHDEGHIMTAQGTELSGKAASLALLAVGVFAMDASRSVWRRSQEKAALEEAAEAALHQRKVELQAMQADAQLAAGRSALAGGGYDDDGLLAEVRARREEARAEGPSFSATLQSACAALNATSRT